MPSSLPAIFILSLVISGCAALQALQSITSISLQLRLRKGGRGRLECKCLIWELTLWLSFSFALRLRELTQIFSLALCCGNKLNVKSYSQATSFVLLETSQGSLNLKSSVGCNHLSFTLSLRRRLLSHRVWPEAAGKSCGCEGKEAEKCLRLQQHLF